MKRETERVCSSIQTMCRSTQFLAKNLDYVQENIEAMQAELIFWCQESKKYMQACEEEQRCVCTTYRVLTSEPL